MILEYDKYIDEIYRYIDRLKIYHLGLILSDCIFDLKILFEDNPIHILF